MLSSVYQLLTQQLGIKKKKKFLAISFAGYLRHEAHNCLMKSKRDFLLYARNQFLVCITIIRSSSSSSTISSSSSSCRRPVIILVYT